MISRGGLPPSRLLALPEELLVHLLAFCDASTLARLAQCARALYHSGPLAPVKLASRKALSPAAHSMLGLARSSYSAGCHLVHAGSCLMRQHWAEVALSEVRLISSGLHEPSTAKNLSELGTHNVLLFSRFWALEAADVAATPQRLLSLGSRLIELAQNADDPLRFRPVVGRRAVVFRPHRKREDASQEGAPPTAATGAADVASSSWANGVAVSFGDDDEREVLLQLPDGALTSFPVECCVNIDDEEAGDDEAEGEGSAGDGEDAAVRRAAPREMRAEMRQVREELKECARRYDKLGDVETLFVPEGEEHKQSRIARAFVRKCCIPRLLIEPDFPLAFALRLHYQQAPRFSTLQFIDMLLRNLPPMATLDSAQAENLGRGIKPVLSLLLRWCSAKEVYARECSPHIGFSTSFGDPSSSSSRALYEDFVQVTFKWYCKTARAFHEALAAGGLSARNALLVLEHVTDEHVFPRMHKVAEHLEAYVGEVLREQSEGEDKAAAADEGEAGGARERSSTAGREEARARRPLAGETSSLAHRYLQRLRDVRSSCVPLHTFLHGAGLSLADQPAAAEWA